MTVNEAIAAADAVKPNAYDSAAKLRWLNEVEGRVRVQIHLTDPEDLTPYALPADGTEALLAPAPFDKLYPAYLEAMIDYANGEYDRYQATAAMFNQCFAEYMRWYATNERPADGWLRA